MKKAILTTTLFLSLFSFVSCGDDDNDTDEMQDPIIGTWTYTADLVNGEDSGPISACNQKSTFVFNVDNTSEDNFFSGDDADNCDEDKGVGTWTKNDDGTYTGMYNDNIEDYIFEFKIEDGRLLIEDEEDGDILTEVYTK